MTGDLQCLYQAALTPTGMRAGLAWRLRAKSMRYQPADRRLKGRYLGRLVLDYNVSFPTGTRESGGFHDFTHCPDPAIDELSGVSVFYQDDAGAVYHTYSSCGRRGEVFLPIYGWLDVVPKGRNETKNGNLSDWVKRHDHYPNDGRTTSVSAS